MTVGHTTVAVVDCHEDYEVIATFLKDISDDINYLSKNKNIQVCGTTVEVELFLGGDMKVVYTH